MLNRVYMQSMMLIDRIKKQLCLVLIAFAIALSGIGMEAAHAKALQDTHSVQKTHAHVDHDNHDLHSGMSLHGDHDTLSETPERHEGHADCAMTACCHLGGVAVPSALTVAEVGEANFASSTAHQYADAEKDRADKPPKHI